MLGHLQRLLQKKRDKNPNYEKSKRYHKLRQRKAKWDERVANQRNDYQHKVSYDLVSEKRNLGLISYEDLNIKGLLKNKRLSRSISNAGWYSLMEKVKYKSGAKGLETQPVGTFYPSSRLCSTCGYKNKDLTLSDREWTCSRCQTLHDRDKNAAINIRNEGLRLYRSKS